jgi:iron complex transport system substrate-binding protein
MKSIHILITLFIFICLNACRSEQNKKDTVVHKISMKHAVGFDIEDHKQFKKLVIKSPYPNANQALEYFLIPKGQNIPEELNDAKIIRTPIETLVVTSTTHIPMLELLNVEESLIGFPNLSYISSKKTRDRIDKNKIKELGNEQNLNTEVLLDLQPDIVIGFAMSSSNIYSSIEKAGIQVLLNGDWLEETPLGRAEWIKFFAVLFNKEQDGEIIFNEIENHYLEAMEIAKNANKTPSVLSGVLFKDVWNLPAGESFVAQFLKDANTNYLWSDSKGKGSLSLSFETVFTEGQHADFWIAPGHYTSLEQLLSDNEHYKEFDAFTANKIYSFANKTGENGGVLYYELAPIQPHVVLKDIIKITHPELLTDYKPFFLEQLN